MAGGSSVLQQRNPEMFDILVTDFATRREFVKGMQSDFVVLTNNAFLPNERALTAGDGIAIVDAGAGSTITLNVDISKQADIGTPASDDVLLIEDVTDGSIKKVQITNLPGGGGAPTNAEYVTLATDVTLTQERVLTPGDGLAGVDGGAGSTYTLNVDISPQSSMGTPATDDILLIEDVTDGSIKKITLANLTSVHSHKLNDIENPDGSKTFTMATHGLKFVFTAPTTYDGAIEIEATGAYTGDLLHIHQHTGNPGSGTHLIHLEADDSDVVPLFTSGAGTYDIDSTKAIKTATFLESTVVTGTAPLTVASTTVVANLNADQADGYDFNQGVQTTDDVVFDSVQTTGTAPASGTGLEMYYSSGGIIRAYDHGGAGYVNLYLEGNVIQLQLDSGFDTLIHGDLGVGETDPDAPLHVTLGGTNQPSFSASTVAIFQNTTDPGGSARVVILADDTGFSILDFADNTDASEGRFDYNHNTGDFKLYIEDQLVYTVDNTAIMTFDDFPITPSLAPSNNYEVANKKYVDDNVVATVQAQYVTLAVHADLTVERVLTGGNGIGLTDGGAGSTVTLDLDTLDGNWNAGNTYSITASDFWVPDGGQVGYSSYNLTFANTGLITATALTFRVSDSTSATLVLTDTGAASNEDNYGFTSDGGVLTGLAINDTFLSSEKWLEVDRTGTAINYIRFYDDTSNQVVEIADTVSIDVQTVVTNATYPVLLAKRTSTATNTVETGSVTQHTTTADMVDGFGASIGFRIEDSAAVENLIATIAAIRDGGDDQGKFGFNVYTGAAWAQPLQVADDRVKMTLAGSTYGVDFLDTTEDAAYGYVGLMIKPDGIGASTYHETIKVVLEPYNNTASFRSAGIVLRDSGDTGTDQWGGIIANDNNMWIDFGNKSGATHSLIFRAGSGFTRVLAFPQGGGINMSETTAEPSDPGTGKCVFWMSNGTGYGDDGDFCIKLNPDGVVKSATIVDFSTL